MDAHQAEEVVLEREEVQQHPIETPTQPADQSAGNRIEDKVVGGGDDGDKDGERVQEAEGKAQKTAPRGNSQPEGPSQSRAQNGASVLRGERDCHNGKTNHERVTEMQGRHGS